MILYHGLPLSFLELKNFTSALNVMNGYQISIEYNALVVLFMMIVSVILCVICRKYGLKTNFTVKKFIRNVGLSVMIISAIYMCYFSNVALKPTKTIAWLWSEAYYKYGYVACTVESIVQSISPFEKPEGYSEEVIDVENYFNLEYNNMSNERLNHLNNGLR